MKLFKKEASPNTDSFSNLISEHTTIDGSVLFSGVIKIQGAVHGPLLSNIESTPKSKKENDCIFVDKTGNVESREISSDDIVIAGNVSSQMIHSNRQLHILAGASITGATIFYKTIHVEQGAILHNCNLKCLDSEFSGQNLNPLTVNTSIPPIL